MKRERQEDLCHPVDIKNVDAFIVWINELRWYLSQIRDVAKEATLPPRQRTCTRRYLRRQVLRLTREMTTRLNAVNLRQIDSVK